MKQHLFLTAALALAASTASAQLQPGDLVLAYPTSGGSSIAAYGPDGMLGHSIVSNESSWISAALMPDGSIAVHNNSNTPSVSFYSAGGILQSSFNYAFTNYAADIDAYANGTIAMCVRDEGIKVFDALGAIVNVFYPPELISPMGCQIQPDQSIWIADRLTFASVPDGRVIHLDPQGNVLFSFDVPYDAADVAVAPDGTLWVIGWESEVGHYHQDGTVIAQWLATIDSSLKTTWSLAVDDAGTVWISGHYDSKVRQYDSLGGVLSEFDTTAAGNSAFGFMMPGSGWITRYCFGDGSSTTCPCANNATAEEGCANSQGNGAVLNGVGSPDALADNLNFDAWGLTPSQPVLLFSADNEVTSAQPAFLFGDGFRCAGGNLKRLGVRTSSATGEAHWGPGLLAAGGWGPGDTRRFQAWYRDPVGSPCGSAFNLSNGVEVNFLP